MHRAGQGRGARKPSAQQDGAQRSPGFPTPGEEAPASFPWALLPTRATGLWREGRSSLSGSPFLSPGCLSD